MSTYIKGEEFLWLGTLLSVEIVSSISDTLSSRVVTLLYWKLDPEDINFDVVLTAQSLLLCFVSDKEISLTAQKLFIFGESTSSMFNSLSSA